MAVKTYYGVCTTAENEQEKTVVVESEQITNDEFEFNIGDLLVVYFQHTNTKANPTIVVTNQDTEQEISTSDDTGKSIKTRSINIDGDGVGAWDGGETVIFAYTFNASNNDNTYYWELINGAPSTESIYGVTKLFGNNSTVVSTWVKGQIDSNDFNRALTPGILKKFYNALVSESEPGTTPLLKMNWFPAETETEMIELGKLSLSNSASDGVTIDFPLNKYIDNRIAAKVSRTSQLANDGPDPSNPGNLNTPGHFYITNVIPKGTQLYYSDSGNNIPFINPCTSNNNCVVVGQDKLILQSRGSGIFLEKYVNNVSSNTLLSVKGNIRTTDNGTISSSGLMSEGGVLLKNKYSGKLEVVTKTVSNISIAKNSSSAHLYCDISRTGWTPIGIVGFNMNYNRNNYKTDADGCFLWECHLLSDGKKIEYAVRNTKNVSVVINIIFNVLYVKNV